MVRDGHPEDVKDVLPNSRKVRHTSADTAGIASLTIAICAYVKSDSSKKGAFPFVPAS